MVARDFATEAQRAQRRLKGGTDIDLDFKMAELSECQQRRRSVQGLIGYQADRMAMFRSALHHVLGVGNDLSTGMRRPQQPR